MIFLQRYKQYTKQISPTNVIGIDDVTQAVINQTANICLLNDLKQGVITNKNNSYIYIYDVGKTTDRYTKRINIIQYSKWKNGIKHGISFKFNIYLDYPQYYVTFKNGMLDGYYFQQVNLKSTFSEKYLKSDKYGYSIYAILAVYKNGYTTHIGCMGFTNKTLHFYKRYKISIPYPCDKTIYQNIIKTQFCFDGWQKSGTNYTYYENGKMAKTVTEDCTEYQVFAHKYVTYDYEVSEDKIDLEICVDRDRLYRLAFGQAEYCDDIKDITGNSVMIAHYIWYKHKPVIIMRRSIAPNYYTKATYELVKLHNGVEGVWTKIEFV